MHWEYKVIHFRAKSTGFIIPKPDYREFEITLSDLGRVGWELVQCNLAQNQGLGRSNCTAVFKRPR